jgi:alpha-beta hydrolase superfamily lysophospholipase
MDQTEFALAGARGRLAVRTWPNEQATHIVLLVHGYGEHIGRYEHVAARLVTGGACVYGPDHYGHGRSEGPRARIDDIDVMASDLGLVARHARQEHPGLPLVVVGHSMGGLIATRFAQRREAEFDALVLSGPAVGSNPDIEALLDLDPIPDVPIDPDALSRDPEVGRAYAADPLVYHGPFQRPTLEGFAVAIANVREGQPFGAIPTLWLHGEDDPIVPLVHTRAAIEDLRGQDFEERSYPGARHEIFNETNQDEVLDDVSTFIARALRQRPAAPDV